MAVKTNVDKVIKNLIKKNKDLLIAIQEGMKLGVGLFEKHIIKTQMSGRPGLKKRTGTLARSGMISWSGRGENYKVTLGYKSKYARIHQYGGVIRPKKSPYLIFRIGRKLIFAKSVTIPKRLHILEDWKRKGREFLVKASIPKVKRVLARI